MNSVIMPEILSKFKWVEFHSEAIKLTKKEIESEVMAALAAPSANALQRHNSNSPRAAVKKRMKKNAKILKNF